MIRQLLRVGKTVAAGSQRARFATNRLSSIIEQLASSTYKEQLVKDEKEEQTLRNYMELTEESYMEHLLRDSKQLGEKAGRIDPSILLMVLPTLEKEEVIREHLLMLFPYLPMLNAKELLLFYEYLLAYKLTSKPKIPPPKPLIGSEALLVLLAEVYPKDFLIEWLKQVPLYTGSNAYMLAMGAFSIVSGLSLKARQSHRKAVDRSLQRIMQLFEAEESEVRIGVILLGLQMEVQFAEQLIVIPYCLDFRQIDGIKLSLLIIELDRYIKHRYSAVKSVNPLKTHSERHAEFEDEVDIDEGVDVKKEQQMEEVWQGYIYDPNNQEHIKFKLEQYLRKLITVFTHLDWKNIIKLHNLVRLFHVLQGKKLEKGWGRFSEKLFSFVIKKEQIATLANLSTAELVGLVEVMEALKVNKPALLKNLLVVLSERLETADKEELVRLAKCLVTYVRVCEDYLIHFRLIIERRKLIFSADDIETLNSHFRRVQVLFPKPLTY